MALINIYVSVLVLHIVKLQPDGEGKILEEYNFLFFIINSVFGTSSCCFRIVPSIDVFFCLNSSDSFKPERSCRW